MKKCPFCRKEIQLQTNKCPNCKMILVEEVNFIKGHSNYLFKNSPKKNNKENTKTIKTRKYNKYLRPYCRKCNIIYSMIKNIGLRNCTRCHNPLVFKSFNPYPKLIIGLIILIIAITTVIFSISPIVWIGGFIWGVIMVSQGFSEWEKIKELDKF